MRRMFIKTTGIWCELEYAIILLEGLFLSYSQLKEYGMERTLHELNVLYRPLLN